MDGINVQSLDLTINEKGASYVAQILDKVVDNIPYSHNHRGLYNNTVVGQSLLKEDAFLTDEQKIKILTFWGEPKADPE